jgi:hypothetical protein
MFSRGRGVGEFPSHRQIERLKDATFGPGYFQLGEINNTVVMLTVSRTWLLAVILRTHVRSAVNLIWAAFAIKIPVAALIVVQDPRIRDVANQTRSLSRQ